MKKKVLFILSASTIAAAAAVALVPHAKGIASFADGCQHSGNHYAAVAATHDHAGNKEFWACCECHEQFLAQPDGGTWVDQGAYAGPELASTHIAYLAPTEHAFGYYGLVENDSAAEIRTYCGECNEPFGDPVNSYTKKAASTAEWTIEQSSQYPWQEAGGVYTNGNQLVASSVSYMTLTVTKAGTISLDWTCWSESGYDYLFALKNYSDAVTTSTKPTSGTSVFSSMTSGMNNVELSGEYSGDYAVGDTLTIIKRADSSSWGSKNGSNYDVATIKFNTNATYSMVTFDSKGGSDVVPGIAADGVLVTDLPVAPTREGYSFDGWYSDEGCTDGNEVDKGSVVGSTVYAKWFDNSQLHVLSGSYKGFGYKVSTTSTSSVTSLLSNITFDVNFKGEVACNSTYFKANSKKVSDIVDGEGTLDVYSVTYVAETGVIILKASSTSSDYVWIFVKDSEQAYTTATVKGCAWGSSTVGYYGALSYPLADGTTRQVFTDSKAAAVHDNVSFVTLNGKETAINALTSTTYGIQVYDASSVLLGTFGYNASTYVPVTDSYYGKYTNSVEGDTEVTTIYVTGAGRFYKDASTSASSYELIEGGIAYASGNKSEEYALNVENKTFERSVPTITVTYDLNGHDATLVKGSGALYELEGLTQKFCKAASSSSGAWLYLSELAKVQDSVSADGLYAFEGWYKEADCSTAATQLHPTENFVLYAKWTRLYQVTQVLGNGEADVITPVKEGATPSLTNPTREGYMFTGWYTDAECTIPYVAGAASSNTVVYAGWAVKPTFALGKYAGFNLYSTGQNQSKSATSSYEITFNDNGDIVKGGSTYGTYSSTSEVVDGALEVGEGKYMAVSNRYNGRYAITGGYSSPSSDPVPNDMLFDIQLFGDESVSFVRTSFTREFGHLVQITITGTDTDETFLAYVDVANDKVYLGVTLDVTAADGTVTHDFADVYNGGYAKTTAIKLDGVTIDTYGASGSTVTKGDAYAGTYEGSMNGVNQSLVLDGFGNATLGEATGTYTGSGTEVTVTIGSTIYKVNLSGASYTQILDGFEGTYAGANGSLVVTGWGDCTLDGVAGTYVVSGTDLKVTVNDVVAFYSIDKTAHTYTSAEASIFAGLTFKGTDKDSYGDDITVSLAFDSSPAIAGTYQFGLSQFSGRFTGVLVDDVLTLTFEKGTYTDIGGKTATFSVQNGKLVVTSTQLSSGIYKISEGVEYKCAEFVYGSGSEGGTETPAATLEAGTYRASVEDMFNGVGVYYLTIDASGTTGSVSYSEGTDSYDVTATECDDSNFDFLFTDQGGNIEIYIKVNADGTLTCNITDYAFYVTETNIVLSK